MPQKINFFFTEANQPSTKAIADFNQQVHRLMSKSIYCPEKLNITIREATHSTLLTPET